MNPLSPWKVTQVVYGQVLDELTALFTKQGFRFMPIKGAYLIFSGLAPKMTVREMKDIDLLLPEDEFDAACRWFASLDNVTETDNYWRFERSFFYTVGAHTSIYIEFHRLINFPARFHLPPENLFARTVNNNGTCALPDPTDALIIHICHMHVHIRNGFSRQSMNEIGLLTSQNAFSWDVFWTRAAETGIVSFIWLVLRTYETVCEENKSIKIPAVKSLYAKALLRTGLFISLKNRLLRRLLFEFPFIKNMWWMLWHQLCHPPNRHYR